MALVATVLLLALNFRRLVDFYDRLYQKTVYWILGKNPRAEIAESKAYEAFLLEEYALALEFYQIAERFGGGSTTHFQRKALTLIKLRDMEGAKEALLRALELDPENPFAHNHMGFLLQEYGRWEDSIEEFQWALAYKEDYAVAWSNLGVSYYHLGDLEKALDCYFFALGIEQDNPLTLFNIAFTYEKMEDWGQARLFYESYIQQAKPEDPQYLRASAHLSILQEAQVPGPPLN
jgi:tetratricopeptide (TPR) repeat protein